MEESELLYGDLEATGLSEELKRKQKENDRLRKEKNEIESELKDARDQIKSVKQLMKRGEKIESEPYLLTTNQSKSTLEITDQSQVNILEPRKKKKRKTKK